MGQSGDEVAATAQETVKPSFDCAKADGEVQQLVCKMPDLARMDNEMTRLYALAEASEHMSADKLAELKATQRGWIKGRDDCWKADEKDHCVMEAYAMRIHDLRQGYADARADDAKGASTGPFAMTCKGLDYGIGVTFIQTEPGAAYLQWKGNGMAMAHVPSASGARYQTMTDGKIASLFTKGDEATLALPGEPERTCKIEDVG
ncbi:hypothetical protein MB02_16130 [Croceicoccus estronivorus]|nr:hypothetical protein MB02_16130 [Croceicoccus estronivorus]